jgi:hypothetical protein
MGGRDVKPNPANKETNTFILFIGPDPPKPRVTVSVFGTAALLKAAIPPCMLKALSTPCLIASRKKVNALIRFDLPAALGPTNTVNGPIGTSNLRNVLKFCPQSLVITVAGGVGASGIYAALYSASM